jgi:hypothetical protein
MRSSGIPQKLAKVPPVSTATILIEEKDLLNRRFLSFQSAVAICGLRAIKLSAQAIMMVNTDRKIPCK